MKAQNIKMLKAKIKIIANFLFDRIMPYKRLRKFSIDRWLYKNESDRYNQYKYNCNSINIFPEESFYHPRWDCLVSENDKRSIYIKKFIKYDFNKLNQLPKKYKQAYSSYFIQTKNNLQSEKIVVKIYDSLLNEGIFRVVTPDSDLAYEAYENQRKDFFEMLSPKNYYFRNDDYYIEIMLATFIAGKDMFNLKSDIKLGIEIRNAFLKMNKELFLDELIYIISCSRNKDLIVNKNWFNYKKLKHTLLKSGFKSVYKSGFGQSKSPQMRDIPLFDSKFPSLSLYVEARK